MGLFPIRGNCIYWHIAWVKDKLFVDIVNQNLEANEAY